MNRQLTPDQRAGLSVIGLLLVLFAAALGLLGYWLFGVPTVDMRGYELAIFAGMAFSAIYGIVCLYRGTG